MHSNLAVSSLHALSPLLALLILGCTEGAPDRRHHSADDSLNPQHGGTAVVATAVDLEGLNPLTIVQLVSWEVAAELLFMPLLKLNEELKPIPHLARSWELSPDSTTLTFHLRDDVFWHDGLRTTAHDVKFSYDLYRDPRTPYGRPTAFRAFLGEAVVLDSLTLQVTMRPFADYLSVWTQLIPLPRHRLEEVRPEGLAHHPFGSTPLGNGPFTFAGREPGASWTFGRNDRFPEALGGPPHLDRIVLRVVPEPTTRVTELLTGAAHVVPLEPVQRARVEGKPRVRSVPYPTPRFTYIAWNTRRPLFQDVRVRRALTMAIDRQAIIDGLLYGDAEPARSPIPPSHPLHDPTAGASLGYDPAAARSMLAEAGWVDRDGDGILENERGEPFRFGLIAARGSAGDLIEKIEADLRRVGVAVQPRLMEGMAVFSTVQARERSFDAYLGFLSLPLPITVLRDTFHCARVDQLRHYSGICDPELDQLLDGLQVAMDPELASGSWRRYQHRLAELQPYTFLFHPRETLGVSERLHGVHPDVRGIFLGADRWWLDQGVR